MSKDADGDVYIVQVLFRTDVVAQTKKEAKEIALDGLARLCESGKGLFVRVEQAK